MPGNAACHPRSLAKALAVFKNIVVIIGAGRLATDAKRQAA